MTSGGMLCGGGPTCSLLGGAPTGAGGMLWGGAATCPALEEASSDCVRSALGGQG